MSKSRGILFSAPMVRALLAGTKTQTRRVMEPDGRFRLGLVCPLDGGPARCPHGAPGDRLWVREAWRADSDHDDKPPRDIAEGAHVWYEADSGLPAIRGLSRQGRLRPGMFMPRWASRISLQITDVRVERLQDISAADCWAEGIPGQPPPGVYIESLGEIARWSDGVVREHPQPAYRALWEYLNGPGSWEANPWVWAVSFKRIEAGA